MVEIPSNYKKEVKPDGTIIYSNTPTQYRTYIQYPHGKPLIDYSSTPTHIITIKPNGERVEKKIKISHEARAHRDVPVVEEERYYNKEGQLTHEYGYLVDNGRGRLERKEVYNPQTGMTSVNKKTGLTTYEERSQARERQAKAEEQRVTQYAKAQGISEVSAAKKLEKKDLYTTQKEYTKQTGNYIETAQFKNAEDAYATEMKRRIKKYSFTEKASQATKPQTFPGLSSISTTKASDKYPPWSSPELSFLLDPQYKPSKYLGMSSTDFEKRGKEFQIESLKSQLGMAMFNAQVTAYNKLPDAQRTELVAAPLISKGRELEKNQRMLNKELQEYNLNVQGRNAAYFTLTKSIEPKTNRAEMLSIQSEIGKSIEAVEKRTDAMNKRFEKVEKTAGYITNPFNPEYSEKSFKGKYATNLLTGVTYGGIGVGEIIARTLDISLVGIKSYLKPKIYTEIDKTTGADVTYKRARFFNYQTLIKEPISKIKESNTFNPFTPEGLTTYTFVVGGGILRGRAVRIAKSYRTGTTSFKGQVVELPQTADTTIRLTKGIQTFQRGGKRLTVKGFKEYKPTSMKVEIAEVVKGDTTVRSVGRITTTDISGKSKSVWKIDTLGDVKPVAFQTVGEGQPITSFGFESTRLTSPTGKQTFEIAKFRSTKNTMEGSIGRPKGKPDSTFITKFNEVTDLGMRGSVYDVEQITTPIINKLPAIKGKKGSFGGEVVNPFNVGEDVFDFKGLGRNDLAIGDVKPDVKIPDYSLMSTSRNKIPVSRIKGVPKYDLGNRWFKVRYIKALRDFSGDFSVMSGVGLKPLSSSGSIPKIKTGSLSKSIDMSIGPSKASSLDIADYRGLDITKVGSIGLASSIGVVDYGFTPKRGINTYVPRVPDPFVPRIPRIRFPALSGGGGGRSGYRGFNMLPRMLTKYQPSLKAVALGEKLKKRRKGSDFLTGIEVRPIEL